VGRDLTELTPEFLEKIEIVLSSVAQSGYDVRPFVTGRDVFTQAKLWRQSRSSEEIKSAVERLKHESAPWLAEVVEGVGPQLGRWATNALPGQSWHQWGEAVDCFVVAENGRGVWSSRHPGYESYASEAKKAGLNSGFYWSRRDAVHVQLRQEGVRAHYTWPEIDAKMLELHRKLEGDR
jgi:hypothetical protein